MGMIIIVIYRKQMSSRKKETKKGTTSVKRRVPQGSLGTHQDLVVSLAIS
jgi:hypothetical protein